ncbi:chitin deacetylase, partial [Nowakowskiella sp. JEL0078]
MFTAQKYLIPPTATPPAVPSKLPTLDQNQMISGDLLTAPLIVAAMEIVKKNVPAALLAIPPSTYVKDSTVTYTADANATCYWPANQCVRRTDGNGYIADVVTCPGTQQWGLTYGKIIQFLGLGPIQSGGVSDTSDIRKQLGLMNLKATFFVVGTNILQYPQELIAHDQAGHQIASHTFTHHPLTSLTNEQIVAEIKYTEVLIYQAIKKIPSFMRPPCKFLTLIKFTHFDGDVDDRVRAILNSLGYRVVIWDRDSGDAETATGATALATIRSWFNSATSFISLQHDISAITGKIAMDALKEIQTLGQNFKLKIMPVSQCIGYAPYWDFNVTTAVSNTTTTRTSSIVTTTEAKSTAVITISQNQQ